MLVLEGLIGLRRTVQLQLLHIIIQGIDLDYCDIEWFALETNQDNFVVLFLIFLTSTAFQTLLLTMMAISFLLGDSGPQ